MDDAIIKNARVDDDGNVVIVTDKGQLKIPRQHAFDAFTKLVPVLVEGASGIGPNFITALIPKEVSVLVKKGGNGTSPFVFAQFQLGEGPNPLRLQLRPEWLSEFAERLQEAERLVRPSQKMN